YIDIFFTTKKSKEFSLSYCHCQLSMFKYRRRVYIYTNKYIHSTLNSSLKIHYLIKFFVIGVSKTLIGFFQVSLSLKV
ncbi:Hypothetical predicted protein, partial [Mytilus galloprovincialis]